MHSLNILVDAFKVRRDGENPDLIRTIPQVSPQIKASQFVEDAFNPNPLGYLKKTAMKSGKINPNPYKDTKLPKFLD